jgi:signal transduction histidine kinase
MARAHGPWGPPTWGVRQRSAVTAVVVVGLALAVGAVVLLSLLQSALVSTARDGLVARASDLSALFAEQGVGEAGATLKESRRPGEVVQVIDSTGAVVAASETRLDAVPLSDLHPAPGQTITTKVTDIPILEDSDDFLLVARGVSIGGNAYLVQVASPVQVQADTVQTVALFLLGATPLILALVGLAVWVLVGRSLGSVERIRQQVDIIDSQRLADRVDVPPTHDEIARLATTMNTMLERLQASDKALRAFFSDASHELRSPLSTLVTTAEIAAADATGRSWIDLQPTVLSESTRMQALVEDLLTLAKADSRALVPKPVEVDLEDVLDIEIRRLRSVTQHRIVARIEPARVAGDAGRLAQVFRNLLDNAVRHAVSSITISTERSGDWVSICIDNDGETVPSEQRERIFQRFVRLEQSRTRDGGGSGLGLAISAEIVALHGGTVKATESPQGWCRFVVTLPVRDW